VTESDLKIAHFIKHFLYTHEVLCIAGLGRFVCETSKFSLDPVSKSISPNYKVIHFTEVEVETSFEFLDYLRQHSNIAYLEEKLRQFGSALRAEILPGKRLEIEGFGYFKFNVLGELVFEPIRGVSFQKESFGLPSVQFSANLLKVKRLELPPEEEQEDTELSQMRESALKELKVMLDQAKISESQVEKKDNKVFPIIATVLTLILLVNLGFFLYTTPSEDHTASVSKMDVLGKTGEVIEQTVDNVKSLETVSPNASTSQEPLDAISMLDLPLHVSQVMARDSFYFDSTAYTEAVLVQPEILPAVEPTPVEQNLEVTVPTRANKILEYSKNEISPVEPIVEGEEFDAITEVETVKVNALKNKIPKGFYVIVGAFRVEDNAANLVLDMRYKGNKNAITVKPANYPFYLASYGRKKSMDQAMKIAAKLKAEESVVWIYAAY
jgi:cell division septation protein DedD